MLAPGHVSARGEDGALLDQRRPDEPDQLAQAEPVHLGPGVGEEAAVQHRDQQEHGGRHQQGAAHYQEPHCNVARGNSNLHTVTAHLMERTEPRCSWPWSAWATS